MKNIIIFLSENFHFFGGKMFSILDRNAILSVTRDDGSRKTIVTEQAHDESYNKTRGQRRLKSACTSTQCGKGSCSMDSPEVVEGTCY